MKPLKLLGKWTMNILVGLDQLANAVLLGDPDETISSRAGKLKRSKKWRAGANIINILFFWQKRHCKKSIEEDEGKDGLL